MFSRCPEQGWASCPWAVEGRGQHCWKLRLDWQARPCFTPIRAIGTDGRAWRPLSPGQKLGHGPAILCPDLHMAGPH